MTIRTRRKTLFELDSDHWKKKRCVVCQQEFIYNVAFEPDTCSNFDCVHTNLHPELNGKRKLAGMYR